MKKNLEINDYKDNDRKRYTKSDRNSHTFDAKFG
jgi:hypothetical protein